MAEYTEGGIPKRKLTLQYKPLGALQDPEDPETNEDTPKVAAGTEIKLYAETIKEIFQKEPTTVPIQKGQDNHFEGDKTLIVDTLKAKHKFEISAWVYSNKGGKHSLENMGSDLSSDGTVATISSDDKIKVSEFDQYIPLGDTGIKFDSETLTNITQSNILTRGFKTEVDDVNTSTNTFFVAGDRTRSIVSGDPLKIENSTGNDGQYSVSSINYDSTSDETEITVNETVSDSTADGVLKANDYEINYSRGEIRLFDVDGSINTTQETTEFFGQTISTTTVISDEFKISYKFDATAKNIARLVRRMSQLGNPLVMRVDDEDISESGDPEFRDAHDYLVIPKKVSIASKSEKPDEYKLELELRKGTIEQ